MVIGHNREVGCSGYRCIDVAVWCHFAFGEKWCRSQRPDVNILCFCDSNCYRLDESGLRYTYILTILKGFDRRPKIQGQWTAKKLKLSRTRKKWCWILAQCKNDKFVRTAVLSSGATFELGFVFSLCPIRSELRLFFHLDCQYPVNFHT